LSEAEGCSRLFNVVLRGYYIVEIKCLLAEQLDGMQNVNQRGPSVVEVVGLARCHGRVSGRQ
jgi:hypothetical protein